MVCQCTFYTVYCCCKIYCAGNCTFLRLANPHIWPMGEVFVRPLCERDALIFCETIRFTVARTNLVAPGWAPLSSVPPLVSTWR